MSGFQDSPLIVLAAGGTGGHMFPAEALAQELKRRGARILLATDVRGMRYAENFPADAQFEISAATPSIGGPVVKVFAALSIAGGLIKAMSEFKKQQPAAAVGFGGYPSFPAMKAAALMKIPYGVHEQNSVLGRANRMLAKGAAFTAHGFGLLEKCPAGAKTIEVGNPVRDAVTALETTSFTPISADSDINILIFGGSQGASLFATSPVQAIASLPEAMRKRLKIVHQAREADEELVKASYAAAGVRAEVAPFFTDLPARMATAHLVISRAGASTVTELAAIGRASILAPLGIAMDDHQTANARILSEASAAILLPESQFNEQSLITALETLLANPERLQSMAEAAKGRVKQGAASALADLVETLCEAGSAA